MTDLHGMYRSEIRRNCESILKISDRLEKSYTKDAYPQRFQIWVSTLQFCSLGYRDDIENLDVSILKQIDELSLQVFEI